MLLHNLFINFIFAYEFRDHLFENFPILLYKITLMHLSKTDLLIGAHRVLSIDLVLKIYEISEAQGLVGLS